MSAHLPGNQFTFQLGTRLAAHLIIWTKIKPSPFKLDIASLTQASMLAENNQTIALPQFPPSLQGHIHFEIT